VSFSLSLSLSLFVCLLSLCVGEYCVLSVCVVYFSLRTDILTISETQYDASATNLLAVLNALCSCANSPTTPFTKLNIINFCGELANVTEAYTVLRGCRAPFIAAYTAVIAETNVCVSLHIATITHRYFSFQKCGQIKSQANNTIANIRAAADPIFVSFHTLLDFAQLIKVSLFLSSVSISISISISII